MEISVGRNTVWRFLCYKKSKMDGKHELKGLNIYGIACYTICNTLFYGINRPELTHKNLYTIWHNNASAPSELLWMNYIKQLINYITWANSKYINTLYIMLLENLCTSLCKHHIPFQVFVSKLRQNRETFLLLFNTNFGTINPKWGGGKFPCPAGLFLWGTGALMTGCSSCRHHDFYRVQTQGLRFTSPVF